MKRLRKLLKNEKGQGATEYILLLALIVGLVFMFKDRLKGMAEKALGKAESQVNQFE